VIHGQRSRNDQAWVAAIGSLAVTTVIGGVVVGLAWLWLSHHRSPSSATMQFRGVSSVDFADPASADFTTLAGGLHFGASTGHVEVVLATPPSRCEVVAAEIGREAHCDASSRTVIDDGVFEARWLTDQSVKLLDSYSGSATRLTVSREGGRYWLSVGLTGDPRPPKLCVARGLAGATLALGSNHGDTIPVSDPVSSCFDDAGLAVDFPSSLPMGESTFRAADLVALSATLGGPRFAVVAEDETITVADGDHDIKLANQRISVESTTAVAVTTQGIPPALTAAADGGTVMVSSLKTDGLERVPDDWARRSRWIQTPILTTIPVVVFVLTWVAVRFEFRKKLAILTTKYRLQRPRSGGNGT
jgi:hypothetical protein